MKFEWKRRKLKLEKNPNNKSNNLFNGTPS